LIPGGFWNREAFCWYDQAMPATVDINEILRLSVEQRLRLIERIWGTIKQDDQVTVPDATIAEMERRLAWAQKNPDKCMTQEQFKARLQALK
jgi:putative addiction module component (TIGR02574 family)